MTGPSRTITRSEGREAEENDRKGSGSPSAASFPRPPRTGTDEEGRPIEIRPAGSDDRDALVGMYDALDREDSAHGLPPPTTAAIRSWLADVLAEGLHLVARHDDRVVGHAFLVPCNEGTWELVVFVASDHQQAGIGTRLLRGLLGYGADRGVECVWLTVRRNNVVARRLYRSAGFERVDDGDQLAGDLEMERPL